MKVANNKEGGDHFVKQMEPLFLRKRETSCLNEFFQIRMLSYIFIGLMVMFWEEQRLDFWFQTLDFSAKGLS